MDRDRIRNQGVPLNFIQLRDYHDALDFYSPVLIASDKTIEENPALVEKFMKATSRGISTASIIRKKPGKFSWKVSRN